MTTLTINSEQYRIRRRDEKNLIIERQKKPKEAGKEATGWEVIGYYGKIEDLAHALLKLAIALPGEAKDLREFLELLRLETRKAESSLASQLKSCVAPYNPDFGQELDDLQPQNEAQL